MRINFYSANLVEFASLQVGNPFDPIQVGDASAQAMGYGQVTAQVRPIGVLSPSAESFLLAYALRQRPADACDDAIGVSRTVSRFPTQRDGETRVGAGGHGRGSSSEGYVPPPKFSPKMNLAWRGWRNAGIWVRDRLSMGERVWTAQELQSMILADDEDLAMIKRAFDYLMSITASWQDVQHLLFSRDKRVGTGVAKLLLERSEICFSALDLNSAIHALGDVIKADVSAEFKSRAEKQIIEAARTANSQILRLLYFMYLDGNADLREVAKRGLDVIIDASQSPQAQAARDALFNTDELYKLGISAKTVVELLVLRIGTLRAAAEEPISSDFDRLSLDRMKVDSALSQSVLSDPLLHRQVARAAVAPAPVAYQRSREDEFDLYICHRLTKTGFPDWSNTLTMAELVKMVDGDLTRHRLCIQLGPWMGRDKLPLIHLLASLAFPICPSKDVGPVDIVLNTAQRNQSGLLARVLQDIDDWVSVAVLGIPLILGGDDSALVSAYREAVENIRFDKNIQKPDFFNATSQLCQPWHGAPAPNQVDVWSSLIEEVESRAPEATALLAKLRALLDMSRRIYSGAVVSFDSIPHASGLPLPQSNPPTIAEIGSLGRSLRARWQRARDGRTKEGIFRVQRALFSFAYGNYGYSTEDELSLQAQKIAVLIDILYGAGFGDDSLTTHADRLYDLAKRATGSTDDRREMMIAAVIARDIAEAVLERYRSIWAPYLQTSSEGNGHYLGSCIFTEQSEFNLKNYPVDLFRSGPGLILANHAEGILATDPTVTVSADIVRILSTPAENIRAVDLPFQAHRFGDRAFPTDVLLVGGKGLSLHQLSLEFPGMVPPGFTLIPRLPGFRLVETDRDLVDAEIRHLEEVTGLKLGEGLTLAVRSGAAVSMPGAMDTVLDADSLNAVYAAVETGYKSWNNETAREFRANNAIPDYLGTSISIQVMVDTRNGGAGVVQSLANGDLHIDYNQGRTGEAVVSKGIAEGSVSPAIGVEIKRVMGRQRGPTEIEFAVDISPNGLERLRLLQRRATPLSYNDRIIWYTQQVRAGTISGPDAVRELGGRERLMAARTVNTLVLAGTEVILGRNPSENRFGSGVPVSGSLVINGSESISDRGIVAAEDPDAKASGALALRTRAVILNRDLPLGSHLAALVRGQNLSAVVGLNFTVEGSTVIFTLPDGSTQTVNVGAIITIDPTTQTIYLGKLTVTQGSSPQRSEIDFLVDD